MLKDPTQKYKHFSPLEFCCALGLVKTVKKLLPNDNYPKKLLSDVQGIRRATEDAIELLTAADLTIMFSNVETLPGTKGEDVEKAHQKAVKQLSWYRSLNTAATYGRAAAVEYLIPRGASLCREDESGKWPIEIAMENKIEPLEQLLLNHHMDSPLQLLHCFINVGNLNNIERLVQLNPKFLTNRVDFETSFGEQSGSILHLSASKGAYHIYQFLTGLGVNPGFEDSEGRKATHFAAAFSQSAFLESILADETASRSAEDISG
ncbi:ankyrin repeat-containing domain protein [Mariannaea sp. PMI_226]|nr:ankyrin repeat-containing domain protein [Mariannaea sp. PMI_226]